MPDTFSLTTIAAVKSWLSATGTAPLNTSDDANIAACIAYFSGMFLWRTGMGNQDGTQPTISLYVTPVSFSEVYDGNGSNRMFLLHRPIQSVASLVINNRTIGPSSGWGNAGYVIDGTKASISLRGGGGGVSQFVDSGQGPGFFEDIQNVAITYTAGYQGIPSDIALCATKSCALQYKRKDWIGLGSKSMAQGAGTTSYEKWELDPDVERLISNYSRVAVI